MGRVFWFIVFLLVSSCCVKLCPQCLVTCVFLCGDSCGVSLVIGCVNNAGKYYGWKNMTFCFDSTVSMYCLFTLLYPWVKGMHCAIFIPFYFLSLGIPHLSEIVEGSSCCSAVWSTKGSSLHCAWAWTGDPFSGHSRAQSPAHFSLSGLGRKNQPAVRRCV